MFIGLIYPHRKELMALMETTQQETSRNLGCAEIAERASATRRRPSFAAQAQTLQWLIPQVEQFRTSAPYTGALLLLLRVAQTSLLILIPSQTIRAAIASCIALIAIATLRELAPYRRASDSATAALCQCVIFSWCFFIMLRDTDALYHVPTVVPGLLLMIGTVFVFGHALSKAHTEMKRDNTLTLPEEVELQQLSSSSPQSLSSPAEHAVVRSVNDDQTAPDAVEAGQLCGASSAAEVDTAEQQGSWGKLLLCATQGADSREGRNSGELAQKEALALIARLTADLKAKETEITSLRAPK